MGDIYALHYENDLDKVDMEDRSVAAMADALMVFIAWEPGLVPRAVRFLMAYVWVRVCGLPFKFLNMHVANVIGHIMGRQFMVDDFEGVPNNDYLRIRVCTT
ncbi:hypothetical protein RND81_11G090000 [Saponaria officinalis]|uniref:DUF4283 domain-containing protein n=1 Tax=Saponaria officinalis TaxID=3572 RepID=A0AAW1HLD6_SAPOF